MKRDADDLFLRSVGEIASESPEKIEVFKKYGVDFCCGGSKTLKEACEESGIDEKFIANELNAVKGRGPEKDKNYVSNQRANDWNTDFLIDYIVNIHHTFLRIHLPEATEYVEKIAHVHGDRHRELIRIRELFIKMSRALIIHLDKEEKELFQHIKNRETDGIMREINDAEYDHEYVGHILKEMNFLSSCYLSPEDACASYRHAYKLLKNISDDIMIHVHLENNILFKKI
ncbi:MAG: iron-sulfur cluster repair di-iron protein [Deltaproteobacteria bacterium]|nr:iron-sulfur cluster repair di-iron protein [Deltaproteobacteria bacterium]